MRLSEFIEKNIEAIVTEWEAFARATIAPAQTMSKLSLRDHATQILAAIAKDLRTPQTESQRFVKSQGLAEPLDGKETSAATHGALRQLVGFDLVQLAAEYRAFRATVLRLWKCEVQTLDVTGVEDIARFNEAVDQALAESISSFAERVADSRDTFLAVLGHDLRTPLSAIVSSLTVIGDPGLQRHQRDRMLQIAKRSAASMRDMITDLLEYTRTRLGRGIEVLPALADFSQLCREVFEEVQAAYSDRAFVAELPAELSAHFDAARMRQVLTNLLGNAVQHGDTSSPITLSLKGADNNVALAVHNYGKSIPPDALQVIFDPLVQFEPDDSTQPRGPNNSLGLGLYIAREIVTAHRGSIAVTSTDAEGTRFTAIFPTVPPEDAWIST